MHSEPEREEEFHPAESATDATELVESGPLDVKSWRLTEGADRAASDQTALNHDVGTISPISVRVFGEFYEVKPSPLYLALETLPLEQASDETRRAYGAFREHVLEDLKEKARDDINHLIGLG
jgi:hypothetical protein